MPPSYTISKALPSDAHAISSLLALSWQDPFTRLQFGKVEDLANAMTPRIAQQIEEGRGTTMVAREEGSGDIVSVATWGTTSQYDREKNGKETETESEREEREAFDEEVYLNSLPPNCNRALVSEFGTRLDILRERIVQGALHLLVKNLATHPGHRGRGLATRLIRHLLDEADKDGLVVYLETGEENKARGLYGRLGFEEKGREGIELERFASREERENVGLGDVHVVIGYVRVPSPTI